MTIRIGNAPCSWGVEFADDPRNPPWSRVLDEASAAGYVGIELGPIGYLPEDPAVLGAALAERGLALIGGVLFRPFHDRSKWQEVRSAARRTCAALVAHGASQLVLIDSIAAERAPTAGRPDEAPRLGGGDLEGTLERVRTMARLGAEEHGLTVSIHPHVGGFIEFEDEMEQVLEAIDPALLKLCIDTGHAVYAGFDPILAYRRHQERVAYLHFKDCDLAVKGRAVANRIGFYDACAAGLFCNLGLGVVDFRALKAALDENGFGGWATVEQDCDPAGKTRPIEDARANLGHLRSVGLA